MGTECRLDVHRSPSPVYFSERCTQEATTIIEMRHECISFNRDDMSAVFFFRSKRLTIAHWFNHSRAESGPQFYS